MAKVRFSFGSVDAFARLQDKRADTIYVINETGDFSPSSPDDDGDIYLGDKLLTGGGEGYVPMPRITTIPSDGVYLPNVLYVLNLDGTARTITLSPSFENQTSEYHLFLTIGEKAPAIMWPRGLTWADGSAPIIAASHVYEINIVENKAYEKDWGASV